MSLAKTSLTLVVALAVTAGLRAQMPGTDVTHVRDLAARFVADYEHRPAVIADEEYVQREVRGGQIIQTRRLQSDLMLVDLGNRTFSDFRDVYEVDGNAVRDRQDRIVAIFTKPGTDALAQAAALVAEGARFNIGDASRTINTPSVLLNFLRRENQSRSTFTLDIPRGGSHVAVLSFRETAQPRMIESSEQTPATGRCWIDLDTGNVTKTELWLSSPDNEVHITVTYRLEPKLGWMVPVAMDESYELSAAPAGVQMNSAARRHETIEGQATYSHYRTTNVNTSLIIR